MEPTDLTEKLLQELEGRKSDSLFGIGVASQYFSSVVPCFEGGGLCPTDVFKNASVDQWKAAIKSAEKRLTYCDPEGETKSFSQGTDISPNAVLEFDGTLITARKDRDGDIMLPKGAKVDQKMPLLWQHIPVQPIGKMVRVIKHDDSQVSMRWAIADTPLGKDAATLVEFGALRMSQGFKPYKYEPVSTKSHDDEGRPNGWKVSSYDVAEGSLVSVPSNVDAVITAFSREKLTTPLVKSWAKKHYDARPTVVPGYSPERDGGNDAPTTEKAGKDGYKMRLKMGSAEQEVTVQTFDELQSIMADKPAEQKSAACGCTKSVDTATTKDAAPEGTKNVDLLTKMIGAERHPRGSFEWIQDKLREKAEDYLGTQGIDCEDCYVMLAATFTDSAVVCVEKWRRVGGYKSKCYQMSWSLGEDGMPAWSGDPKEVEVAPQIIEKAVELHTKMSGQPEGEKPAEVTPPTDPAVLTKLLNVYADADQLHEARNAITKQIDYLEAQELLKLESLL